MRAASQLVMLFAVVLPLRAQSLVTFQLDLNSLVKEQLFSPDQGHRVFVRGSFNTWQGTDYELIRNAEGTLYTGTFEIAGSPGDTLEFKYVLERGSDRFFWEHNPDPANLNHGNRRLVLEENLQLVGPAIFCYDEYFTFPVIFSKDKLQADFMQFRAILEETHPALYDYTEKEILDSLFDCKYAAIESELDFNSFLMLMTEVIARVGCGHSSLWLPGEYWQVAPDGLFPLQVQPSGERYYVTDSYCDKDQLAVGSEIQSVNGEPMEAIATRLKSLTSTDGKNQAFRRAKVGQHFSVKYALAYGFPETFRIGYLPPEGQHPEEVLLKPVSKEQVDQAKNEYNELSMRELSQGKVALLTINTFAYYGQVDMFKSFVDSVFRVVHQKNIDQLIIDLRGNGGGDPFCASYLWGYLQHEPVPYFEDHYGRYDTLANAIPQPDLHYSGKLFTLIDGLCFSSTGHFVGLLDYHQVGKFVGTETGATYTCTGNATYPKLDNTGIMVGTARVMRYTAAVKNMNPLHGVLPDYPAEASPKDLITGRDAVLEYALSLTRDH